MSSDKIRTRKITKNICASVISAHPTTDLDAPLWAINWFDLRKKWLYDFYNFISFSHVKKIDGRPLFKGRLKMILHGSERLQRRCILIVRYPDTEALLDMIAEPSFQSKSKLRQSAVRHFQYGFMKRQDNGEEPTAQFNTYKGDLKYLVHVCENGQPLEVDAIKDFASKRDVFTHFIGHKSALLGWQKGRGHLQTTDFMLSHVLVFAAFDDQTLEDMVASDFYQQIIDKNDSNFIGLYEREV